MTERMQRLAQFCVDTRFEDLPPALVAQAKRHILDTFGASPAGAGSEVAKQARQVFADETGDTLIWGGASKHLNRWFVCTGLFAGKPRSYRVRRRATIN
jgi:2-methylcitrate dehydratase PrpD